MRSNTLSFNHNLYAGADDMANKPLDNKAPKEELYIELPGNRIRVREMKGGVNMPELLKLLKGFANEQKSPDRH
jgi:hypothetical protein